MSGKKQTLLFIGIILTGICYALFYSIDFTSWLSTGDHGRDYYVFERVYEGDLPYKDFWWVYGPLMPYFYGLFYKLIGTYIPSIIVGQYFLIFACSLLTYFILSLFIPRLHALFGALWFILNGAPFGFTYNHIGGIFFILLNLYFLSSYLKSKNGLCLYGCIASVFFLLLIKLNFGVVTIFGTVLSVIIIDFVYRIPLNRTKKIFYSLIIFAAPLLAFIIYYWLAHTLTIAELRQCFPYFSEDHPHNATPLKALKEYYKIKKTYLANSKIFTIFSLILVSFLSILPLRLYHKKDRIVFKNDMTLLVLMLCGFWILNLHEFLASGVGYRILWSNPYKIIIVTILVSLSIRHYNRFIRYAFYFFVFLIIGVQLHQYGITIKKAQGPQTYLHLDRGKIHIGRAPLHAYTIMQATKFINQNLKKDELFFAFPYDPIYYFLTDRKSPSRQLIFFDHINIPEDQERSIIEELEENRVDWILLSNRILSYEHKLGFFGKTYCPLLHEYMKDYFQIEKQIGDWKHHPGWANNHGVVILKRTNPYTP